MLVDAYSPVLVDAYSPVLVDAYLLRQQVSLWPPDCAAVAYPHRLALFVAYCLPLNINISDCNASAQAVPSYGMGPECYGMLQQLTVWRRGWYASARDRLSPEHCAQHLPFDKPGLSFRCRSGTDKPIRLCPAKRAPTDRPCLSQALSPFTSACGVCSVPSEPRKPKSNNTERRRRSRAGLLWLP